MDSDHSIQMHHLVSGSSSATAFYTPPMPYRCTVRNVDAVNDANFTSASGTLTFDKASSTSVDLGQIQWAAASAGTDGTWTADASSGSAVLEKGTILRVTPLTKGSVEISINIELDPYALTSKGY